MFSSPPPSAFALYTSPPKTAKYSATWFKQLTFSNATDIIYPAAHKSHAISQWTFSPDIPSGQAATVIAANEAVPSMEDLAPILQGMESAYSTGSRSVAVTLTVAGESSSHLYHFSKVCPSFVTVCLTNSEILDSNVQPHQQQSHSG
jgi:hypothetical protein